GTAPGTDLRHSGLCLVETGESRIPTICPLRAWAADSLLARGWCLTSGVAAAAHPHTSQGSLPSPARARSGRGHRVHHPTAPADRVPPPSHGAPTERSRTTSAR